MLAATQDERLASCSRLMQWSDGERSDAEIFFLAALSAVALKTHFGTHTVNGEKPHQGVAPQNRAPHQGQPGCNSTTALPVSWSWWSGTALGAGVSYDYDAFGNLINSTGSTPNNYLFAGEQHDPALGLYYNRARYYNNATGRFWSMDDYEGSSSDPLSLHKYLYADASPSNSIDPSGNDTMGEMMVSAAINITLAAMNAYSLVGNTASFIESTASAYGYFSDDDPWNGTVAVGSAALHLGLAVLSGYGIKASLNLPPPPSALVAFSGSAAVQALWLNPQFVDWTFELLWPALIGSGGIYLAKSIPGHTADWELRDSQGRIQTRGTAESGGTGNSKPTWPQQLASHTERKILDQLAGKTQPGQIITIRGDLPPCRPGCSPAMRAFAQENGVKILYSVEDQVWTFKADGSVETPY